MNPPSSPAGAAVARSTPALRALRYLVRVPMLLWHVFVHLPITLLLLTPPTAKWRIGDEPFHARVIRAWQAGLMRVFGFRLER